MVPLQAIIDAFSLEGPFFVACFLDCCRIDFGIDVNNQTWREPYKTTEVVRRRTVTNAGFLVGFACAPGLKASDNEKEQNGLFTKHLLQHIVKPRKDIHKMFYAVTQAVRDSGARQVPEFTASIATEEDIYLCEQAPGSLLNLPA